MHICFISQEYPPETGWGGIGTYVYEIAHGLVAYGHQVTVISKSVGKEMVTNDRGVAVHRINSNSKINKMRGLWRLGQLWPGFSWNAYNRLREITRISNVDIVEAPEIRADALFIPYLKKDIKLIIRLHTAWIFVDRYNNIVPDQKKKLIYFLERRSICDSTWITSPSNAILALTEQWIGRKVKNSLVIPNPIDTQKFRPSGLQRQNAVLFTSRLESRKGIDSIARILPFVLSENRDVEFYFFGKDSQDQSGNSWQLKIIKSLSEEQRRRVSFSQLNRVDLLDQYNQASICLLPSKWENFPYSLLEAMSCGLPIVATRVGGIPEMVKDGVSGLLVAANNDDKLAKAVLSLAGDPNLRETMGKNARNIVEEKFCLEHLLPEYLRFYRSL